MRCIIPRSRNHGTGISSEGQSKKGFLAVHHHHSSLSKIQGSSSSASVRLGWIRSDSETPQKSKRSLWAESEGEADKEGPQVF